MCSQEDHIFQLYSANLCASYVPGINESVLVTHRDNYQTYLQMPVSPLQTSQPTPPGKRHTVGSVLTNDGQQMRSDKVNQAARRHQRKRRRSRKSKRRCYSTTRQDAAVTHNIHEEKMNNGQPAPHTVCSTAPPGLGNLAAPRISSTRTRDLYATVTQNVHEQKMENGQPQTDKVLSTVPLCLGHMTAAGIPSMSIRDLYATVTHNINEERMKNGQPQPDATITHSIHEQKMGYVQPAPDNVLLTLQPGLINMAGAGISSMSTRDLGKFFC
uniref:putative SAGE1-like protein isoform X2 n=1 Tax=Callithrix jacchus TaxID=9483 RepID=UPI0023DD25CE|nr:putative SAGE1-like protein isoform X2 [Callithrix jacchus]